MRKGVLIGTLLFAMLWQLSGCSSQEVDKKEATAAAAGDPIHIHNVRKFWVKEWKVVRLWTFTSHNLP